MFQDKNLNFGMCDMEYNFETLINLQNIGNMKATTALEARCPEQAVVMAGAEMDFATAPIITQTLADFSKRGIYGFTLADEAFRVAICHWMESVRAFDVTAEEIVPTLGTIFALGTAMRAFTHQGDGVIVQHPSYYRYDVNIRDNGRIVISDPLIEKDGVYTIDFTHLETLMSEPKNKLLVLCNPHNPTGKVFAPEDLLHIASLANRYGVVVFSDEIFAEITFNGHTALAYVEVDPVFGITSTSLGKAFNLTGVNHANLIIKDHTLRRRYLEQRKRDHFGSIDPFFYNALIAGYSKAGFDWLQSMKQHVIKNYLRICSFFKERLPMITASPLEGSFVVWVDLRNLGLSDEALRSFLLNEALIVADFGTDYGPGGSGFVRLNIATTSERIEAFLAHLETACKERFFWTDCETTDKRGMV
jgi:cystathionine beta-lyase